MNTPSAVEALRDADTKKKTRTSAVSKNELHTIAGEAYLPNLRISTVSALTMLPSSFYLVKTVNPIAERDRLFCNLACTA
jgi:hypothetical protein